MHSAVEQTRYWMWTRRKFSWRHFNSSPSLTPGSSFESWEEKAFAEDSAGHLGGCVWPPRSYSCSFCKREFRSAQALGGHMNVHRRDRARLKQPPSPTSDDHSSHHPLNPHASLGSHNQTQVCSLVYNFNPNPNPTSGVAASNVSPKVSVVSNQEKCSDHILISPTYSSSITKEDRDESLLCTPPAKDFITIQQLGDAELKLGRENWRLSEVGSRRKRNIDQADCKVPSNKRTKMDSMFPFFGGPGFGDQQFLPSEALKLGPSIVEDLDLELRLGDPPKVK